MIEFLFKAIFFATPLVLNLQNSEFFEVPKMYFLYAATLATFIVHLLHQLKNKQPIFQYSPALLPLFIFYISQFIATVFSIDPYTSFFGYYSRLNGGLLSLTAFCLLFLILSNHLTEQLKEKLITVSLISGTIISFYGILEHFGIDKSFWVQDVQSRVFSTLGQPNWLAAYLCILLPLSLHRWLTTRTTPTIFFYGLTTALFTLCLFYTKSKSGLLAAAISLLFFYLLHFIYHHPPLKKILFGLGLVVLFPLATYLFTPVPPQKAATSPAAPVIITPSSEIRQVVWQGALSLWKRYPFFGTGPETFAFTYYWTRPTSHNLTSEWNYIYNKAHNEYLNYLATSGTIGLLAYLALILFSIYQFFTSSSPYKLALFSSFLSILITNFFGFSVVVTSLYFFLLPLFTYNSPTPAPAKQTKLLSIFLLLVSGYLLLVTFRYYLADIAFAHPTISNLEYALNTRPHEAIYHSKYASTLPPTEPDKVAYHSTTAVKLSPFNLNLWKERSQTLYLLSTVDPKYFSLAISSLITATKLAPTDPVPYYLLGRYYQSASLDPEAVTFLQKAIDLKPNYDHALFALGEIRYRQKDYRSAQSLFESTIKIAPTNKEAQNYLEKMSHLTNLGQ